MAKSISRSNILNVKIEKKYLKFVCTNILVSVLRKDTQILVETNFRSSVFYFTIQNVASGHTFYY